MNENYATLKLFKEAALKGDTKTTKSLHHKLIPEADKSIHRLLSQHKTKSIYHILLTSFVDWSTYSKERKNPDRAYYKALLEFLIEYCNQKSIRIYIDVKECRPGDIICVTPGLTYQYYEDFVDDDGDLSWICSRLYLNNESKHRAGPFDSITAGIHTSPEYSFCLNKHFFFFTF